MASLAWVRKRVSTFCPSSPVRLTAFVALVAGTGLAIGALNIPGDWYAGLNKPWYNPPDWLFAPVWSVLFVIIALAGYRTFERQPRGRAMKLWGLQLALNFAWSPIFFSLHEMAIAVFVIVLLLATILAFICICWRSDRPSAALFVPYAAWVAFAFILNASLVAMN